MRLALCIGGVIIAAAAFAFIFVLKEQILPAALDAESSIAKASPALTAASAYTVTATAQASPAVSFSAPQASPETSKSESPAMPAASNKLITARPTQSPAASPNTQTAKKKPYAGQVVVVIASGYKAKVAFYEWKGGIWVQRLQTDGCIGREGLADDKREGDMKTPKGMYGLSLAFGTDKLKTAMKFRFITGNSYWVDDSRSKYYNTWQEGYKGWKSAEKLSAAADYYHYAVVIDYNTKRTPGKGSAIFLHCKVKEYTSGCVAVPEKDMIQILKWLDPAKHPVIIIGDSIASVDSHGVITLP